MKNLKFFGVRIALLVGVTIFTTPFPTKAEERAISILDGAVRDRGGEFVLIESFGPGGNKETEAVGERGVLEEAAGLTDKIFRGDAENGLVGRTNPLKLRVRKRLDGSVEILSFAPHSDGPRENLRGVGGIFRAEGLTQKTCPQP